MASKTTKYKAKKNSRFSDNDAQIIGSYLDKKFPGGNCTAEEVVDVAKSSRSPIHKYFDWDDTSAARKYRLQQAGQMIRCVVLNIEDSDNEIPKMVSIKFETNHGIKRSYVNTEKAFNIPDAMDQVLAEAIQNLKGWEKRFRMFKNHEKLSRIFAEIRKL